MKMVSVLVAAILGLAILAAFVLVVINRASPDVVKAAVPVALAALGAVAVVFAYNVPPPVTRLFPVAFFVQRSDKYPVLIPGRPFPDFTLALFDQGVQAVPGLLDRERYRDSGGGPLFHEFLQAAIVDRIATRHFGAWRMRATRFDYGGGVQEEWAPTEDSSSYKKMVLSKDDLSKALGENPFASVHSMIGTLALPPRTVLTIQPPNDDQVGEIRLKNAFCDVRIRTRRSISSVGLGAYTSILGVPIQEAQDRFWTVQFVTTIDASFSKLLFGHPSMAAYREWVDGIIDGLALAFDEQALWRATADNLLRRQQFPPDQSIPLPGIGPIRSTPPAPPE